MLIRLIGDASCMLHSFENNRINLSLDDIDFVVEKEIVEKQKDSLYIFCEKDLANTSKKNMSNVIILGVDITLPCSIYEIAGLIRQKIISLQCYKFCGVIFKYNLFSIFNSDGALLLKLTAKESDIMRYIIEKEKSGATSNELLHNILGYSDEIETSAIEAHVYRLRNKLHSIGLTDIIAHIKNRYVFNKDIKKLEV